MYAFLVTQTEHKLTEYEGIDGRSLVEETPVELKRLKEARALLVRDSVVVSSLVLDLPSLPPGRVNVLLRWWRRRRWLAGGGRFGVVVGGD